MTTRQAGEPLVHPEAFQERQFAFFEELGSKALLLPDILIQEIPENASATDLETWIVEIGGVVAGMTPLQQADSLQRILRRFPKHPKKAIRDAWSLAIGRAVKKQREEEQEKREREKGPPPERRMKGLVFNVENGIERELPDGSRERISTFDVALRKVIAQKDGPDLLCLEVYGPEGLTETLVENWIVPHKAWASKNTFKLCLPHHRMVWLGTDEETGGLLASLTWNGTGHVPRVMGTALLGLHFIQGEKGGWRFVTVAGTLSCDGWMAEPDIVYLPDGGSAIVHKLPREKQDLADPKALALAASFLEEAPLSHEPELLGVALGWGMASLFKSRLVPLLGGFPHLNVHGEPGSGKTRWVCDVMWPAIGGVERREPLSCATTHFVECRDFSSSNAIFLA